MDPVVKHELKNGVAAPAIISRPVKFGDDLSFEDRQTLRAVVRKVHRRWFADYPTNEQCDQFIEAMGDEIQAKTLVKALEANKEA